jgi:hypothetical protein
MPATRSARAIDGGEDGDGTCWTAKPRQILRKREFGQGASRGERLSVARAFHRTPHVHRRWARAPQTSPTAGHKNRAVALLAGRGGGIYRPLFNPGWCLKPGLTDTLWSRFQPPTGTNGAGHGARPFGPGSCLEPGPKGSDEPWPMAPEARPAPWPHEPVLMPPLVPVRRWTGINALFRPGPKPCFLLVLLNNKVVYAFLRATTR